MIGAAIGLGNVDGRACLLPGRDGGERAGEGYRGPAGSGGRPAVGVGRGVGQGGGARPATPIGAHRAGDHRAVRGGQRDLGESTVGDGHRGGLGRADLDGPVSGLLRHRGRGRNRVRRDRRRHVARRGTPAQEQHPGAAPRGPARTHRTSCQSPPYARPRPCAHRRTDVARSARRRYSDREVGVGAQCAGHRGDHECTRSGCDRSQGTWISIGCGRCSARGLTAR